MIDVRVALFDVFGTVVDWRSGIASNARHWFAAHAPDRVDLDPFEFADRWRARYQPSMQPIRDGTRGFTALDVLHRENLVELLSELDIDANDDAVDALNAAWHALPPWPDSVAGLTAIRQLMPVAPLSNGNVSLLMDMARNAGLPWDTILGAQVVRAYKPTPESYLRTAELLDLEPGHCLMVAAHNDDLEAAQACGLRTAFVRRPLEHGPGGADPGPTGDWDIVVRDLVELGAVLAQTRRS